MKRFYALLAIFFVLAVFGIFELQKFSKKRVVKRVQDQRESTMTFEQRINNKDYLKKLVESKKPIRCTFSNLEEGPEVRGTMYFDAEKVRSDMTARDRTYTLKTSHSIVKEGIMYLWYDDATSGMALNIERYTEANQSTQTGDLPEGLSNSGDPESFLKDFKYECDLWDADQLLFNLPVDVKFIDGQSYLDAYSRALCKKCDEETTDASRLLCRKMLSCTQ